MDEPVPVLEPVVPRRPRQIPAVVVLLVIVAVAVVVASGVLFLGRPAPSTGTPLRLVVVGGGDLAPTVASWAVQHPSVTIAGHVTREEVCRILGQSRAVVVPSQWEETFGMVAVEAMAAGTPAVASAHGAFPELITPGSDGALFPPTDIDALVKIFADIDDHPAQWDAYGQTARQTYQTRFSQDAGIARLLEIYRFAVDNPIECSRRRTQDAADPSERSPSGVTP